MSTVNQTYHSSFKAHRCCVLIPTYNNAQTLAMVIDSVLQYTDDVVIVNDGSTDATAEILKGYPHLHIVTQPANAGKGKPAAIVTRLAGKAVLEPTVSQCALTGEVLARMHVAGQDFPVFQPHLRDVFLLDHLDRIGRGKIRSRIKGARIFAAQPRHHRLFARLDEMHAGGRQPDQAKRTEHDRQPALAAWPLRQPEVRATRAAAAPTRAGLAKAVRTVKGPPMQ